MPKRTGNSSVNSSIRQNTESTNEGFGALLAAQEASLGELVSIKALLELSKDQEKNKAMTSGNADLADIQDKILSTLEDQLTTTKRRAKEQQDYEREWRIESGHIADMAKLMDTQGNVFQQMGESFKQKKEGIKEKYGGGLGGGLGRTIMGAVNVGGVFNKSIEKSKFREKQRALGGDASNENAEQAYKASQDIKAHDTQIEKFKKSTGLNDEQIRSTKRGSEMMERRNVLTDAYSATDKATHVFDPSIRGREVTPEGAKTPTQSAADSMQNAEAQLEGAKSQEQMAELFKKIEENTRGGRGAAENVKPEKVSGGGIMDMITGFLGDGFMSALKTMFSPKNILKSLGKVFAIGMVVGALFEGIMDGFDEFMESGDIGKALIAGLTGIVDFLTFGLFDKDAIKEVIGDMAGWINDHVVKPFVDFAVSLKDSFLALVQSIGIPEIKFKIPVIGKEVAIGPFYPFKSEGGGKSPEAPAPTSASTVDQKSADNAASAVPAQQAGSTTVVNAPTNNNTTQNQNIRAPIRNQDSSATRYADSRLRQA